MKSIEITTTQNVTIEYELAPLGARGLAAFLDWLLVWLLYGVLILVLRGAWMGVGIARPCVAADCADWLFFRV